MNDVDCKYIPTATIPIHQVVRFTPPYCYSTSDVAGAHLFSDERECFAAFACSPGTTDTVYIVFVLLWWVEVDNV